MSPLNVFTGIYIITSTLIVSLCLGLILADAMHDTSVGPLVMGLGALTTPISVGLFMKRVGAGRS